MEDLILLNTLQIDIEIEYSPIRIPVGFFVETDMLVLKFLEAQGTILIKKEQKLEESHFLILNLTMKLQCGNGIRINIENKRIKSPEINPCSYGQLTFDKGDIVKMGKNSHREKIVSSTNGAGTTGKSHGIE